MANKMPIKWHEENLKNITDYNNRQIKELKRLQEEVNRRTSEIQFLAVQIETAKRMKKDGFNGEKFLKSISPKT